MSIARTASFGLAAALLASAASPALAGGIERSTQSMGILFEKGRVLELSFGQVRPSISGTDAKGFKTGNIADAYSTLGLAYKQDFGNNLSAAIILDQPFGADIAWTPVTQGGSALLGGTEATVSSRALTGVLRYRMDSGFGVHGGLRYETSEAEVKLAGAGFGPLAGYTARMDADSALGWVAGVSWEKPEIAARVALTYNSPIEHEFDTAESLNPAGSTKTKVKTPRSWNLEFQTGVAQDTLVFGSVRWVKWSEFTVKPKVFTSVTGQSLVDIPDTTTWTLGVGRKFTDNWSGSASFTYEAEGEGLVSPLAGWHGRKGVTLAAIYTMDNIKITAGINYTMLGDADTRPNLSPGTPVVTPAARMTDNDSVGVGVKMMMSF